MPKLCFIYTDTNGLHKSNEYVSTKNLYKFARLIAMHYVIGDYNDGKFTESFRKNIILKPKTINFDSNAMKIHKITLSDANMKGIDNNVAINTLAKDIENVDIIISFNLAFHLKAILVECIRTAIPIEFNKKILVCMGSFGHQHKYPKYAELVKTFNIDVKKTQLNQYMDLYFFLYDAYKKGLTNTVIDDECDFVD